MSDADRIAADVAAGAAPPAGLMALHEAIKGRLAPVAERFWGFKTKSGQPRAPQLLDGWVPPKLPDLEAFPFLIVRPLGGDDGEQGADQKSTVDVDLVLGVYGDENDSWLDLMNLIDAIRDDLLTVPTIDGTLFEATGPHKWEQEQQQPRPQWLAVYHTKWTIPRPDRREGG